MPEDCGGVVSRTTALLNPSSMKMAFGHALGLRPKVRRGIKGAPEACSIRKGFQLRRGRAKLKKGG